MNVSEVQQLRHGVYRVYWADPDPRYGYSVGVVGSASDGSRWLACSNWTGDRRVNTRTDGTTFATVPTVALLESWRNVERVELIEAWGDGWPQHLHLDPCSDCGRQDGG